MTPIDPADYAGSAGRSSCSIHHRTDALFAAEQSLTGGHRPGEGPMSADKGFARRRWGRACPAGRSTSIQGMGWRLRPVQT